MKYHETLTVDLLQTVTLTQSSFESFDVFNEDSPVLFLISSLLVLITFFGVKRNIKVK